MRIELYHPDHLTQLSYLLNSHFNVIIPGWSLTENHIEKKLYRNPGEYIIGPWVVERKTLLVIERERVVAAAHLMRYGTGEEVGENYQNVGEIAWLLFWPRHDDAAQTLLQACHDQMRAWTVKDTFIWNGSMMSTCAGIPPEWPHIIALFTNAGYAPDIDSGEAIYGGWLHGIPLPGDAPVAGVEVRRMMRGAGVAFVAFAGDQEIGLCLCDVDLTDGNARPALKGWAQLDSMDVEEAWRNRGIGTWLVRHAVEWMRLAGCDRITLSVLPDDEERGAGRFYQRFGWQPFTRVHTRWGRQDIGAE
jgi:GNAT superfamily N-acetyltransferase